MAIASGRVKGRNSVSNVNLAKGGYQTSMSKGRFSLGKASDHLQVASIREKPSKTMLAADLKQLLGLLHGIVELVLWACSR
jgi:hypothetical protein